MRWADFHVRVAIGLVALGLLAAPAARAQEAPPAQVPGTRPAEGQVVAMSAMASASSVAPLVTDTGRLSLSVDAVGTNDPDGGVAVIEKPTAATVRSAHLFAASTGFSGYVPVDGDVTIDGEPVSWDPALTIPNSISSYNVAADVTAMVQDKLDNTFSLEVEFTLAEGSQTELIDGSILAVVFDDPSAVEVSTVVLLYGAQQVTGDTISLGRPASSDGDIGLELGLGISFGYQPAGQYSTVTVNGELISSQAGGQDDGEDDNGALITVGGYSDHIDNPAFPSQTDDDCSSAPTCDDELYDLTVPLGDQATSSIEIATANPSADDNVFFASLVAKGTTLLVGEGVALSPVQQVAIPSNPASVDARVVDDEGEPVAGADVTLHVVSGPNQGQTRSATTDPSGEATAILSSSSTGTDVVEATYVGSDGIERRSSPVRVVWAERADRVILGDSYSSGEGSGFTGFYFEGTDDSSNKCHRTSNAWTFQLVSRTPRDDAPIAFHACSGAVTDNFHSDTQYDEPAPQLERSGVDADADLITFTIGGNDVGFSDVVKTCIWRNDCTSGRFRIPGTDIGGSVVDSTNARIDELEGTLGALYLDMRNRVGEETSILTSSYPHLVSGDFCAKAVYFGANERAFFRQGVNRMANRIESAAEDAGIHFFDVRDTFDGHEVCGSDGEWINAISSPVVHSFHPNVDGQVGWARAVGDHVEDLVAAGVPLNDAGFPINPQPGVPFARGAFAAPALAEGDVMVSVGRLDLEIAEDPECVGSFSPGQRLRISGGGFAPHSTVELTHHADGAEPLLVSTFEADALGRIDQVVAIPDDAVLSDRSGLELVGGTPEQEVLVLVELVNVVGPDHPCAAVDRFDFGGFESPVAPPPEVNGARAGRSIPIKFSLGGDEGLEVFATGSPTSQRIACGSGEAESDLEEIQTAGSSGLTYDSSTGLYTYVWQTRRQWADTCRRLYVDFTDGSRHHADFDFR